MGDDAVLAPLVRKLRNARAELRATVTAAVLDQIAAAQTAPDGVVAEGVASIVAALVKLLDGELLSATDRAELRNVGRRWLAAGMDRDAVTAAVALASQSVQRSLLTAADRHRFGRAKDRRAAIELGGVALLHAASVVQQAVAADSVRENGAKGAAGTLADRMLAATPESLPAVEAEAAKAGLDGPFGLVTVLPGRARAGDAAKVASTVAKRDGGLSGSVQPDPIPHVPVMLAAADEAGWRLALKHVAVDVADAGCAMVAAPGGVVPLRKLPLVYGLCRSHLPFTSVLPVRSAVVGFAELHLLGMLADIPLTRRHERFESIAGALLGRPELLHLLDALVAIGPYKEVEAVLGKPYRTITDGVGEIKRRTGHDWNEPRGRYLLTMAAHLRWLAALSLAEFDEANWGPLPRFAALGGMEGPNVAS